MSYQHIKPLTCSCCLIPIDHDQIGEIDEDGDIICLACLAEAEETDD